tara:strand:+ start:580 stop:1233 length:654 start_codon:yes stop_codon:yes gene_type:complete
MKLASKGLLSLAVIAMVSCSNPSSKEGEHSSETETKETTAETCTYAYDAASTTVSWTAFKTTEKVGVGGKFDEITIEGTQDAEDVAGVFSGATFTIPVSSVNTENPDRDEKIKTYFFGQLTNTENITGSLKSLGEDGKGIVAIKFNDVEKDTELDYTVEGETVTLSGVIDVSEWQAEPGVEALNEQCYDLHKGADGVSKLWPDVKIEITSTVTKECM